MRTIIQERLPFSFGEHKVTSHSGSKLLAARQDEMDLLLYWLSDTEQKRVEELVIVTRPGEELPSDLQGGEFISLILPHNSTYKEVLLFRYFGRLWWR
tara:strand:+ start:455 stop:748 length:294 start_codon:yes stop_codon:yes gene_type:complete